MDEATEALLLGARVDQARLFGRQVRVFYDELTDAQWDSLLIPISMAFFFQSSAAEKVVVLYPSPAGATESLMPWPWDRMLPQGLDLGQTSPYVVVEAAGECEGVGVVGGVEEDRRGAARLRGSLTGRTRTRRCRR